MEKAVPRYRRAGRSISVSAVPFGPGTDIWRYCRFFGALFRALVGLPGGIRSFVSCDLGAKHCRLRHLGWEKCGHGLTSRPRESASEGLLDELLVLFGYPSGSAAALLAGELSLRCCFGRFACRVPTWGLQCMMQLLILSPQLSQLCNELFWIHLTRSTNNLLDSGL